jgi:hypothetical protein
VGGSRTLLLTNAMASPRVALDVPPPLLLRARDHALTAEKATERSDARAHDYFPTSSADVHCWGGRLSSPACSIAELSAAPIEPMPRTHGLPNDRDRLRSGDRGDPAARMPTRQPDSGPTQQAMR